MNLSESTHTLLSLSQLLSGKVFSTDVRENIRLIRENETQGLCLYVLKEVDQHTEFFEIRELLRKQGHDTSVMWCDREELEKISQQFSAEDEAIAGSSDFQNLNLSLIEEAVSLRGSDIHIRIESKFTSVLYRIDGNLRRMRTESAEWGTRMMNTLFNSMSEQQSHSSLSYNEPCDARVREEFVNSYGLSTCRFASRPGGQGRLAVAIRLVSRRKKSLSFDELGLTPSEENILRRRLSSGGTFYSGPTGHGKSTVCQCSAEFLAVEDTGENFMSVEDPIESPIEGLFQTPRGKQTFGEAIRNMLRMDPDRLYIGEIREADSAIATIEGILTGVSVITTIHNQNPVDILQRLRNFGVELDLLFDPTIISCLVGLRLVPLLCPKCRVPWHVGRESVSPYMRDLVETYAGSEGVYLREPDGCDCCDQSGIRGRIGVFEVIETDNEFMRLYAGKGKLTAYLNWMEKGGVTLCANATRLIKEGRADPVWVHRRICNLDRDARLKMGSEL
ncbi:GspE/PulE family protein [Rahnella sikkimica]|uniref:Conjugal transfer protein n=1 Tax=Rahnella sikkimica TaxID=1805933 RepID=A0A2L1UZ43_9GAMM|nr:ATPase, T2SS/T4P/T4SS family [Rahnella sikkimica]AVF38200.1 conjugal transfer protein [Rahnella sikkimica]